MVRTDGHQAHVLTVPLAQTIEERSWSPQLQRCDHRAVEAVVSPAQLLPGPAGRRVEEIRDVHDQAPVWLSIRLRPCMSWPCSPRLTAWARPAQHQVEIATMKAL
jgi:hypothetical protein